MSRVLLVVSDLGPCRGGTFAGRLAAALPARHAVTVIALAQSPSAGAAALGAAGVSVRRVPIRAVGRFWRLVREATPTVLHAVGPVAATLCRLLVPGVPLVASGLADDTWACRPLFRRVRREAVSLIACAPADSDPMAARAALGVGPTDLVIVAAGRFDIVADLRAAVWAFDAVRTAQPDSATLVLIGDGPGRDAVQRFAHAVGVADRVRLVGSQPDLPRLLPAADVVWLTHRRGGNTLAAEALAAGVPVVGFATSDALEAVGDAGVLVPTGDKMALAAATLELLATPARRSALVAAGRARAVSEFSPAAVAARFAAVYDALAAPPPA